MKVVAHLLVAASVAIAPAHGQRAAVSAGLSPEAAAETFTRTLLDVCVPAVKGNGVTALAAARDGKVRPTQDAETRRQAAAAPDDTVWDVSDARGVVTVRERSGHCVVAVYGPAATSTILAAMKGLSGLGFEAVAGNGGATQALLGSSDGKRVTVQLNGAEPGVAGNLSKFSVVTATVSVAR